MTVSRGRLRLARALAVLFAVLWGFLFFGLIDLLVVVIQDQRFAQHYLLESGWGLLYLVLVAAPLLAAAVRPASGVPLTQVLLVAVAVAAAALLAGYPQQLWPASALAVTALAVGWAAGAPVPRLSLRAVDLPLGALAVVALPAGALYAWSQARGWRGLAPDITFGLDHRPMQAALGLAVPLVAGLAAVALGSRPPLWRVPVWTVAFPAAWLGVESVAYPDHEASLGTVLGIAAAVWGVAFAATAEVRARGRRAPVAPAPGRATRGKR